MEKIGFFQNNDMSEPAQALDEQVFKKKLLGGPEGLEIVYAPPNPGMGQGLRRASASTRLDIPSLWRALIRRPAGKGQGPAVSLLAPRGASAADVGAKLTAAGVTAVGMAAGPESFDCTLAGDTSSIEAVGFAVAAIEAISGPPATREWQWAVRDKGRVPH